ncbi:ATP-binding protein [Paenibacillus aceris]|uniref:histidine kinase n=1 Tax=Paenibacillus aceris TaxID=869555 RepID=A0ABS4I931_9BACL|nr:ATP-binding protein [Paenibacillus aceris]MBP1967373.1 two-component system sporulation sensor kinase B [Paenibacillus aceris]NHW39271.1 two-component sensor histidine kinase [Paenibacillus aceris]
MNLFDDLLLNILVLTIPIVLTHIVWLDRPGTLDSYDRYSQVFIIFICTLAAIFCMTHPFFKLIGNHFDLHIIPVLIAFLYSGIRAGLAVSGIILTYAYMMNGPNFIWFVTLLAILIPFILAFIALSNWKHLAPKMMFPTLLAFISALATFCITLLYRVSSFIPVDRVFLLYGLLYCLVHLLTMWLLTYLISRIRENITMRQETQRSEKLNVLSELAASVAHEIRNPMTVARGFMQILSQSQVSEEKKQVYTGMVIEEIDRAQSIITDYLSFAKPEAEKLEPLDVSALPSKLSNLLQPYAAARGVDIQFDMELSLVIQANVDKMMQCLVNLTKNGIEAMPAGGVLHIEGFKKGKQVILKIKDNGVGMTAEQINRLGTPFYSTTNKSTGLSMMVSYRIIRTFGGFIEVTSQPDQGTCFTISLPAV